MRIGIFDSGVGGLTVMRDLATAFPCAKIIYVGDTARVPYGTRSKETIKKYAKEIANFLLKKNIDVLVVACNTVSAVALNDIKKMAKVPVVGMIDPVVDEAVNFLASKNIGVIGTRATINSGAYEKAIKKINKSVKVTNIACPLFVPFAEEGWQGEKAITLVVKEYFRDNFKKIDCLILGCTHYPILMPAIKKNLDPKVKILTCGEPASREVGKVVGTVSDIIKVTNCKKPIYEFYATDDVERFKYLAQIFLGKKIVSVKKLNLDKIDIM